MEKKIQIEYPSCDLDKILFHTNFLLVSKNITAVRDATCELPLSFTKESEVADEIFALDGVMQVDVSCYAVIVRRSSKLFEWEPIETSVKNILQKYDPTPKLEDLENLFQ